MLEMSVLVSGFTIAFGKMWGEKRRTKEIGWWVGRGNQLKFDGCGE